MEEDKNYYFTLILLKNGTIYDISFVKIQCNNLINAINAFHSDSADPSGYYEK